MSDLTATNCGCSTNSCNNNGCFGGGNCIWIILLLLFCGGCGNGSSSLFGGSCGCNDSGNNCCEWIIWILLLSCFCGNGNGCGC